MWKRTNQPDKQKQLQKGKQNKKNKERRAVLLPKHLVDRELRDFGATRSNHLVSVFVKPNRLTHVVALGTFIPGSLGTRFMA